MKRSSILLLSLLLSSTATFAQTKVTMGVTRGKDFGVTYLLPKTEVEIEIKSVKTTFTPGEFGKYAERYLRMNNVSVDSDEYWELSEVKAKAVGVPDKERTYFVKLKDKTVAPLMELTEDGIVRSINMPLSTRKEVVAQPQPAKTARINPRSFLTEEILMANSTAKMAELVAKEIYSIRESKNALLRGQADNMPKDGEQLRIMLEKLEEQERAMTEMFTGTKTKEEKTHVIRITPSKEMKGEVLFRFSKKLGILGANNLAGEPVYVSLTNLKTLNIPAEDKKKELEGIAYNVPGKAQIVIERNNEELVKEDISVTQFGTLEYLAPQLFDKKSTIKVLFDPSTGGLIKVDREEESK